MVRSEGMSPCAAVEERRSTSGLKWHVEVGPDRFTSWRREQEAISKNVNDPEPSPALLSFLQGSGLLAEAARV